MKKKVFAALLVLCLIGAQLPFVTHADPTTSFYPTSWDYVETQWTYAYNDGDVIIAAKAMYVGICSNGERMYNWQNMQIIDKKTSWGGIKVTYTAFIDGSRALDHCDHTSTYTVTLPPQPVGPIFDTKPIFKEIGAKILP